MRGFLKKSDDSLKVARKNRGNDGAKHLLLQQSPGAVYGAYVKTAVDASGC